MRLNWFSPLPPAKSGIADYTARLVPTLSQFAEIVLWTDQEEWDPALRQHADVRHYQLEDMPWVEINRGTMSVYHIGNNHLLHSHIWQVSRRQAGIVILHDTALHQLFAGLFREQWHDRAGYFELMEQYYGPSGRQDAADFWVGRLTIDYMAQQYRLTQFALEPALAALLHTPRGLEELKPNSPCPLAYAPLPYFASPQPHLHHEDSRDSRADGAPRRLIVFGHISDNRRLTSLLQALGGFSERQRFRLDVYGELWDRQRVNKQIKALDLEELVTLHGFVAPEELDAALATAHLAVNLRYPTMGEASVSQLQIWDHGLPSLVTKVGWYASISEEAVAFVRPEHEMTDIQAHLRAFLDDPGRFAKMGEHGRRILEAHHTPGAYAQALVNLVGDAQAYRPNAIANELGRRVGREMRIWTNLPPLDVSSYLWGHVVGLSQPEAETRKRMAGISYEHLDALKSMHGLLSERVQRLNRQLSGGLQALRRAATEEYYTSQPQSSAAVLSSLSNGGGTASTASMRSNGQVLASQTLPSADDLISAACASHQEPEKPSSRAGAPTRAMSEGGPRKSYTREDALRYPLSIDAHDTGFRYLFNFMVVAKSLGLKPGDEVLDFGAGSCFVSELLNRFGYTTVAFDIDQEVLAIGQERLGLDPRCDRERSRFVAGDGMRLPFRDESFDGIICMNALHHMPDYRATLAEMGRVLRSGGRAVFAEPGEEHSKSPESIMAMEQYGALEKDVVLSEIYQLAKEVGFQRMILKPYVAPDMVELDYDEFNRFQEGGKVSGMFLTPGEISVFIKGQPLFYLEKGGTRRLTSANAPAATLRAKIVIKECPSRISQGQSLKVVAFCENVGQSSWLAKRKVCGYVTFGVKLLTSDGRVLEDSRGRQLLSKDVPPGGHIQIISEVSLEGLEQGSYRVLFDMVNERVCWFQSVGSEVVERWIEIV